jgi:hypothetical protein
MIGHICNPRLFGRWRQEDCSSRQTRLHHKTLSQKPQKNKKMVFLFGNKLFWEWVIITKYWRKETKYKNNQLHWLSQIISFGSKGKQMSCFKSSENLSYNIDPVFQIWVLGERSNPQSDLRSCGPGKKGSLSGFTLWPREGHEPTGQRGCP